MSIVPKETIEVIAQSIGINNLSPDVALAVAPDVEYRIRQIMQEAIKCMRHSRRTTLTADDVDAALNLKNVEPIYGFASGGPLRFKRALGQRDLFYINDKDIDLKDVIEASLPKAPLDTAVTCHWLAIEGVQPAIPENAPVDVISAPSDIKKNEQKDDNLPVDIKLPVKHVLSKELQLYFDKVAELTLNESDSVLFKEALVSLATDSGLHPLVPYFTCFIADEVSHGLNNFPLLFALMRVVNSLLKNPHIHIEPYLHQLMPSIVTCLVAKRLGSRLADNHWGLRDFTANLVASICKRFGHVYSNLQSRLTKTLQNAFLDPKKAMTQHYGAIQGLGALGPNVVRLLLLPNLETYMRLLEPEMLLEKQKNEMKRHEAWRVYGALLRAAGQCIYDRLKIFPAFPCPLPHAVWKTNARVLTSPTHKRKASPGQLEQQPPLKKTATDGDVSVVLANSSPSHKQGEAGTQASSVDSIIGSSSSSGQMKNEISLDGEVISNRGDTRALKTSAALAQVWKDELNSGRILVLLFELFGEDIISFIPAPEIFFQDAVFFQDHLNWQETHSICHGKHHLLGFPLEFFQINCAIQVVVELYEQGFINTRKLIWVRLHINTKVGLQNPQASKLLQHLFIGEKTIMICVKVSKPDIYRVIKCFFIVKEVDNGVTIQNFYTHFSLLLDIKWKVV